MSEQLEKSAPEQAELAGDVLDVQLDDVETVQSEDVAVEDRQVELEGVEAPVETPISSTDVADSEAQHELMRAVEATLFASEESLSAEQIAEHLGLNEKGVSEVRQMLILLKNHYEGRGILLVDRGKRWHFETAPDLAHLLRREKEDVRRLSRAATEVLAIVAYHEPVSRAEIEAIRGVQTAKGTLDVLMEAGWVRVAGRREVPGRPVIYATTPSFLDHFGLKSLRELPGIDELRASGLLDPVDDEMIDAVMESAKQEPVTKEETAST